MAACTSDEPGTSNWLVSSFNDDPQEKGAADTLNRGLAAKMAVERYREEEPLSLRDQWNLFLQEAHEMAIDSVPDDEVLLLKQSQKLYASWNKFCKQLPDEKSQEMTSQIPSLRYLFQTIEAASKTWDEDKDTKNFGRIKKTFAKLCDNMNDHKALLSIIPTNDKYVSLLSGSLTAIAQASMNHQEIANGVANSLEELSEDIAYWSRLVQDSGNPKKIYRYVRELYVVVFEFLTEIFSKWSKSSWKRFLTSFDGNAFDKLFNEKRTRMRAIEQRMQRYIDLDFRKGVSQKLGEIEAGFRKMYRDQENTVVDQRNLMMELGADVQRLLDQRLGGLPMVGLAEVKDTSLPTSTSTSMLAITNSAVPLSMSVVSPGSRIHSKHNEEPSDIGEREHNAGHRYIKNEIVKLLNPLADKYGQDMKIVTATTSQASQAMINIRVKNNITTWIRSNEDESLWIQGPHDVSCPSLNTLTAVCLVALCNQQKIPSVSYFCDLRIEEFSKSKVFDQEQELMAMLKSLLVQMVLVMPDVVDSRLDFSQARFEKVLLDSVSFDDILQLLCDLRCVSPPYLHCVISGIEALEDRGNREYTKTLLRMLHGITNMHSSVVPSKSDRGFELLAKDTEHPRPRTTKICLTTNGYVDTLAQLVGDDQLRKIEYSQEAGESLDDESDSVMRYWHDQID
ncbi:hypothetical protein ARAM_004744 [Aspergillus rambellii]|uniref:DUF7708 domain-containing protein n=1 Tax=Aspergillus rambellii TaxID=308745 RepID=A0A0F8V041_9EURO|nr:hypothetical protein ARAM_004744 [Aspergillus rambellii]